MKTKSPPVKRIHAIEYAAIRALRGVLLVLPVETSSWLMGKIWQFFGKFNDRQQRVLRHLEWAFPDHMTDENRLRVTSRMWENLGRTFAEGLIIDRIISDPDRFNVDAPEFQGSWASADNGAIIVTHHFGNWELASVPTLSFAGRDLLGIYKRVKNPLVEKFFLDLRRAGYPGGLYCEQDSAASRAMQWVRDGGDMAMVADLRDPKGLCIDFFDMPAHVTGFPAALARRFGRPLYAAQLRRVKGVTFELDFAEIEVPYTDDKKSDVWTATQRAHKQFEDWITRHPEQWMWAPYRWSARRDHTQKPMSWQEFMQHEFCTKEKQS